MAKYIITPHIDELIKKCYLEKVGMGADSKGNAPVRDLAKRLNLPRYKISKRAMELGLVQPSKREQSTWTEEEIALLEKHGHKSPDSIQRLLRQHSFKRTITAIVLKRKRLCILSNLAGYNANSLAICFGVDRGTVAAWIKKGWLNAKKRKTERTSQQGGDIFFIKHKDVRDFVTNYVSIIDFRKIDKHWLVDLLSNKVAA